MRALTIFLFTLFSLSMCIGCGGGTTGTSPTNDLRFAGTVQTQDGVAVGGTEMAVSSLQSGIVLVSSSTDSIGAFQMTLPSNEEKLRVELPLDDATSVGPSVTLVRRIARPSIFHAVLEVSADSSARRLFQEEARVVRADCDGAEVSPYEVDLSGVVTETRCSVDIEFASEGVSGSGNGRGLIDGVCEETGAREVLSEFPAPNGMLSVELSTLNRLDCNDLRIVLRAEGDSRKGAIIPVLR